MQNRVLRMLFADLHIGRKYKIAGTPHKFICKITRPRASKYEMRSPDTRSPLQWISHTIHLRLPQPPGKKKPAQRDVRNYRQF